MSLSNEQPKQAGDIDTSFGNRGHLDTAESSVLGRALAIALSSNDAITHATELYGDMSIGRALVNGTKDPGFNEAKWHFAENDYSRPNRVLLQKLNNQDERVVIIGESLIKDSTGYLRYRPAVMRLLPNGNPDLVFGRIILPTPDNYQPEFGFAIPTSDGCLQQDDKILITAVYNVGEPRVYESRLYCLTRTGELDNQFQGGFINIRLHNEPAAICAVQTQSSGNIIVAGLYRGSNITLARYSPTGILDSTFGTDGFIDISTLPPSEITNMATTQVNNPSRLLVMADDRIIFTGNVFRRPPLKEDGLVMRLTADGKLDSSFNNGKLVYATLDSMHVDLTTVALQKDGKIVIAGRGRHLDSSVHPLYAHKWRLFATGQIDSTFNNESLVGEVSDIAIQTTGRILLAGSSGIGWQDRQPRITALTGQ